MGANEVVMGIKVRLRCNGFSDLNVNSINKD